MTTRLAATRLTRFLRRTGLGAGAATATAIHTAGADIGLPCVKITHDATGAEIPPERQPELDLADEDQDATVQRLLIGV